MTSELSFHIHVDNIIPHADETASQQVFKIWKAAQQFFSATNYECVSSDGSKILDVQVELDLSSAVEIIESAIQRSGSLDAYRELHAENSDTDVGASLAMTIQSTDKAAPLSIENAYYIASTFKQQLFLTLNLAYPGSCKLIGARFIGPDAHLYEAQSFDSKPFYEARMSTKEQAWPTCLDFALSTIWSWMNEQSFSRSDIAISSINKVLVNILKQAQQRHRFGSRSALLATQQFELLLNTRNEKLLRNRTRLVLGDIPESGDCFVALFQLRQDLFEGNHPVKRPALICHSVLSESREQITSHNSTIELALSITLALTQRLISTGKNKYQFEESLA